jgi:hypothetical protein
MARAFHHKSTTAAVAARRTRQQDVGGLCPNGGRADHYEPADDFAGAADNESQADVGPLSDGQCLSFPSGAACAIVPP